jgi:hypothetical protein
MVFREINNKENKKKLKLKFLAGKNIKLIDLRNGSMLELMISSDGSLIFELQSPSDFQFYQYAVK